MQPNHKAHKQACVHEAQMTMTQKQRGSVCVFEHPGLSHSFKIKTAQIWNCSARQQTRPRLSSYLLLPSDCWWCSHCGLLCVILFFRFLLMEISLCCINEFIDSSLVVKVQNKLWKPIKCGRLPAHAELHQIAFFHMFFQPFSNDKHTLRPQSAVSAEYKGPRLHRKNEYLKFCTAFLCSAALHSEPLYSPPWRFTIIRLHL